MKIQFKRLKYKNFLSTGNDWIEIILDQNPLTLIIGLNGCGKTTIIDALTFALFGRAFRNINKPEIVNTINKENCVVELEFSIGHKNYKLIRGIKPNIFEIWVNGKMLPQDARNPDYQKYFEKNHLRFNFKAFSQVIVIGSKSYTPFMQLDAANRRSVVEDLLDIQIYSVMSLFIKKKISDLKTEIVNSINSLELIKQKVGLVKSNIVSNNTKTTQKLNGNLQEIKKTKIEIENLEVKISNNEIKIHNLSNTEKEKNDFSNKREKLLEFKVKIEHMKNKLEKEIDFYKDNDVCPTCNQAINEIFKLDIMSDKTSKLMDVDVGYDTIQEQITKLTTKLKDNSEKLKKIKEFIDENSGYKIQIKNYNDWISRIETENESINTGLYDNTKNNNDLILFESELEEKTKFHNTLLQNRNDLEIAVSILKDSGIKASNIKQYIPIINNYINKYLSFMDFCINFTLDETFSEKIYHRYRDEFSYENLSDGEKLRLDLAILFAWRSVAKLKNSVDSNILIMDEILDSSLDLDGIEDFFKLISSLTQNNIFIISHRDGVVDRFTNVIKFVKTKDFSELE